VAVTGTELLNRFLNALPVPIVVTLFHGSVFFVSGGAFFCTLYCSGLTYMNSMRMELTGPYANARLLGFYSTSFAVWNPNIDGSGFYWSGVTNAPWGIWQGSISTNWLFLSHTTTNELRLYTSCFTSRTPNYLYADGFNGVRDFILNKAKTAFYVTSMVRKQQMRDRCHLACSALRFRDTGFVSAF
jgi:hypothetical protein